MALIACVGDVHASDRAPSSCTDSYGEDILELLEQCMTVCRVRNVDAFVIAGDLFHHKAPSRTSHKLVQRLQDVLQLHMEYRALTDPHRNFAVYITPGNHDLQNDRLESLKVSQPLGVLVKSGLTVLDGWAPPDMQGEISLPIYGLPWQQHWTDEVVAKVLEPWRRQIFETGIGCHKPLVITHAPLYPPGKELPWENYPAKNFAERMGRSGSVYYGHVHEPHGTYKVERVQFCNNGALSRGSLHEYNLHRQVGLTLFDTLKGEFEFVPLHAKPAEQVFRLQEKKQVTDMQGRLDDFLSTIGSAELEIMSVESVTEHIRGMGLGEGVESLVRELLTEAGK